MERPLSFLYGSQKSLPQDIDVCVVWKLHVIRASHHRDQKIIRRVWRFARLADHSKHGIKTLETYSSPISVKLGQQSMGVN